MGALRSHCVQALLAVLPCTQGQSVATRIPGSPTTVVYGGHEYRTMMPDVPAEGDRWSSPLCHESCHQLPEGYEMAPANDDVINNVIAAFTWSTHGAHHNVSVPTHTRRLQSAALVVQYWLPSQKPGSAVDTLPTSRQQRDLVQAIRMVTVRPRQERAPTPAVGNVRGRATRF